MIIETIFTMVLYWCLDHIFWTVLKNIEAQIWSEIVFKKLRRTGDLSMETFLMIKEGIFNHTVGVEQSLKKN